MYELLLVSQSPRRREILEDAGFLFRVDTVQISELIEENVNWGEAIAQLASTKAQAYLQEHKGLKGREILVLSADTMVISQGRALGKPQNSTEAEVFLRELSGGEHSVITGVYVQNMKSGDTFLGYDETKVEFRKLAENEIREYVATGEPLDKAGAYAIQGGAKKFVSHISGSMTNVIGLPLELLEKVLREKDWHVARRKN